MELPTYTSIWRIEKRLYKLYDFRLPMPLPVGQIAVFAAITIPYVVLLTVLGLPFNHNLFWLYVLPPGVLTWLATRPVLESKRLPELVTSQLRYLGEPSSWCRMAPLAEKDEIALYGRVWRRGEPALVLEAIDAEEIAAVAEAEAAARQAELAGTQAARRQLRGTRQQGIQRPGIQPGIQQPGRARPQAPPPEWASRASAAPAQQRAVSPAGPAGSPAGAKGAGSNGDRHAPLRAAHTRAREIERAAAVGWPEGEGGRAVGTPLTRHGGADAARRPAPPARPGADTGRQATPRTPWIPLTVHAPQQGATHPPEQGAPERGHVPPHPLGPEWQRQAGGSQAPATPHRPGSGPQRADPGSPGSAGDPQTPASARWPGTAPQRPDPRMREPVGRSEAPAPDSPGTAPDSPGAAPQRAGLGLPEPAGPTRRPVPERSAPPITIVPAQRFTAGPSATDGRGDHRGGAVQTGTGWADDHEPAGGQGGAGPAGAGPAGAGSAEAASAGGRRGDVGRAGTGATGEGPPGARAGLGPLGDRPPGSGPVAAGPVGWPGDPRPAGVASAGTGQAAAAAASAAAVGAATAGTAGADSEAAGASPPGVDEVHNAGAAGTRPAGPGAADRVREEAPALGPVPVRGTRQPPAVERALGGPSGRPAAGWRSHVTVVPGGQGPGRPDPAKEARSRAALPLARPHLVVVLGCTVGAGQTVTALMLAELLASLRGEPVAALDLNPGPSSLTELAGLPAIPVSALLAPRTPTGQPAHAAPRRGHSGKASRETPRRPDVICDDPAGEGSWTTGGQAAGAPGIRLVSGPGAGGSAPEGGGQGQAGPTGARGGDAGQRDGAGQHDGASHGDGRGSSQGAGAGPGAGSVSRAGGVSGRPGRLFEFLASRYRLTLADPGAAAVARVLPAADQLVLVAPASPDAARAVAMTLEWLAANGHGALSANSIVVMNGVSQRSAPHAEQAGAVVRGRCRAIVRVPWDDHLAEPEAERGIRESLAGTDAPSRLERLRPPVRQAYTALAGVLVSALATAPQRGRAAR